jgi:hypothetical protein
MTKQKKQLKAGRPAPPVNEPAAQPTQEEIAKRAHEIYLARGGAQGCDMDDWLQAERELKQQRGKVT